MVRILIHHNATANPDTDLEIGPSERVGKRKLPKGRQAPHGNPERSPDASHQITDLGIAMDDTEEKEKRRK